MTNLGTSTIIDEYRDFEIIRKADHAILCRKKDDFTHRIDKVSTVGEAKTKIDNWWESHV